ncbi:tail fiber protein [Alloalcanivorax gelatiniphagus]
MGEPYIGEIRMFAGNYPPNGWEFCHGQQMQIAENDALYTLIGTIYGGDGQSTFHLPDLRSRVPIHFATPDQVGRTEGTETVTLTAQQMPLHSHAVPVSTATASSSSAVGGIPANLPSETAWAPMASPQPMGTTSATGGSQPHDNVQPYLGLSFIISLYGVFPTPA